ncbi:MAG: TonB-dependent receptor [bacterium]
MKIIFCLLASLFLAIPLNADMYGYNDSVQLYVPKEGVVSAEKMEESIENTGKWVTIVTREDIEKNFDITVLEAIRNFSGIHIIPRGPFGGYTETHLRGGRAGDVLVLIDGVKVNNPASIDRSFDWGTLSTSAVERIEIIRGPQCALYGSDAISGVINIITRKGQKNLIDSGKTSTVKSYGSVVLRPCFIPTAIKGMYNIFSEQAGFIGATNKFDYSLSVFNINSGGLSQALGPDSLPAPEKDGYVNREAFAKLNFYPLSKLSIGLTGGYRDSKIDVDAGPFRDDSNAVTSVVSKLGSFFINHKLTNSWNYKLSVAANNIETTDKDEPDMFDSTKKDDSYEGNYIIGEWQNNFKVNKFLNTIAGFEYAKESGKSCGCERNAHTQDTTNLPLKYLSNRSAYVEIMPHYRSIFFNLNGRIDDYVEFGAYKTWQASLSFLVNSTQVKANYGIGFKMPSLYQLFSPQYGNSELIPETNHSFDVGGESRFKNGIMSITYYHQHIVNSIDLLDRYRNREPGIEICTEGVEIYYLLYITKDISTDISFTGLDKINNAKDYLLLPSLDYRWGMTYKWFNVKFCCIGKRQDIDYLNGLTGITDVRSCSHIDLTNSFKFKGIKIQLKIENLIDDKSMEAEGYTATGRGFNIGISY